MAWRQYGRGISGIALAGMFAALSISCLYLSALFPGAGLGITAAAGLFPAGAVISGGLKFGFLCYGTTGVIGLLFIPEKGNVVLYLLFFGLWPMLKSIFEQIRDRRVMWICKLAACNALLALLWFAFRSVLLPFLPDVFRPVWMAAAAGNLGFIAYDICFSKLIGFYMMRIDKVLRKYT